jgi:hypothetical protein
MAPISICSSDKGALFDVLDDDEETEVSPGPGRRPWQALFF